MSDSEMEEFSFEKWIADLGISAAGCKKLEIAEVRDESAITLMDDITLSTVKLATGDQVKFRRGQLDLRSKLEKTPKLDDAGAPAVPVPDAKQVCDGTQGVPTYTMDQFAAFLAGRPLNTSGGPALSGLVPGSQQTGFVQQQQYLQQQQHQAVPSLPSYNTVNSLPFASLPVASNGGGYGRSIDQAGMFQGFRQWRRLWSSIGTL
jgi:hypothetical protein